MVSGLAVDAGAGNVNQARALYEGEDYLPVQQYALGQVDFLFAALTQKLLYLIAAVGEGGELVREWRASQWFLVTKDILPAPLGQGDGRRNDSSQIPMTDRRVGH